VRPQQLIVSRRHWRKARGVLRRKLPAQIRIEYEHVRLIDRDEPANRPGQPFIHITYRDAHVFSSDKKIDPRVTRYIDAPATGLTLSKGLGAPAGSILLGKKDFIDEARIWRKRLGGGMRQIGILAAAGLIALEGGPKRLREDHQNARALAEGIANIDGIAIDVEKVVTNIVIFDITATGKTSAEIVAALKESSILAVGFGDLIRMVTHLDVSRQDIENTLGHLRVILSDK